MNQKLVDAKEADVQRLMNQAQELRRPYLQENEDARAMPQAMPPEKWTEHDELITQAEAAAKEADEAREQLRSVDSRNAANERLSALETRSKEPVYPAPLPGTREQHARGQSAEDLAESFDENGFRWEKIENRLHQRTLGAAPSINYRNRSSTLSGCAGRTAASWTTSG